MSNQSELDEQIDEVLRELFIQGYYDGRMDEYAKGQAVSTYEAKQELLALIEQREREARIDELEGYRWSDYEGDSSYVMERIEELKK